MTTSKQPSSKKYEIWMEGFLCTGMEGTPATASFVGESYGVDFRDAVLNWYKKHPNINFNPETLSDWGCRLYPTKKEAQQFENGISNA